MSQKTSEKTWNALENIDFCCQDIPTLMGGKYTSPFDYFVNANEDEKKILRKDFELAECWRTIRWFKGGIQSAWKNIWWKRKKTISI